MLHALAIVIAVLVSALLTFFATVQFLDSTRLWADQGLGAIFPMFGISGILAIIVATIVVSLIK